MKAMKSIITIVFVIFVSFNLYSQTASVKGVVTDSESGMYVQGAGLSLSPENELNDTTSTPTLKCDEIEGSETPTMFISSPSRKCMRHRFIINAKYFLISVKI